MNTKNIDDLLLPLTTDDISGKSISHITYSGNGKEIIDWVTENVRSFRAGEVLNTAFTPRLYTRKLMVNTRGSKVFRRVPVKKYGEWSVRWSGGYYPIRGITRKSGNGIFMFYYEVENASFLF